jgi:hypothetical protein
MALTPAKIFLVVVYIFKIVLSVLLLYDYITLENPQFDDLQITLDKLTSRGQIGVDSTCQHFFVKKQIENEPLRKICRTLQTR